MTLVVLCPLIRSRHWFFRGFDFPRAQALILIIIYFFFGLLYLSPSLEYWIFVGLCLISIGLDIHRIGFYTKLYPVESKQSSLNTKSTFKILSLNVFIKNEDYARVIDLVLAEEPDLLLLLETDEKWRVGLSVLEDKYRYKKLLPQDNTYGMFLYSKYELLNVQVYNLTDKTVPSIHAEFKINKSDESVNLFCVHPRPPRPGEASSLQRDSELVKIAKIVSNLENKPALVIGDLNDVAWSHTTRLFRRLSKTLDPRIGRGFYNTFPANSKFFSFPLDHAFHTKELGLKDIKVLPTVGSDHLPISISFDILKSTSGCDPEKPSVSDLEEANKTLEESKSWKGPEKEVDS